MLGPAILAFSLLLYDSFDERLIRLIKLFFSLRLSESYAELAISKFQFYN